MDPTKYVYVPIIEKRRNDDGTVDVFGKVAGSDLDMDEQVLNEKWLAAELPRWFDTGANVREQHANIAAGIGRELEQKGDDWYLKTTVIDPVSCAKVEAGLLQGYSVGIKNGRVLTKSARAPKGEIVGGRIVEVSLVDRSANETCRLTLVKSAGANDDMLPLEDPEYVVWDEASKSFKPDPDFISERAELVKAGGLPPLKPGGSERYPINNAKELHDAMKALGRAKPGDKQEIIKHIKSRAKALKLTDELTDTYKLVAGELNKDAAEYTANIQSALRGLAALIVSEAQELAEGEDERADISQLLSAVYALWCFWESESREGEVPAPEGNDDMEFNLSTVADLVKSASADDATQEQKDEVAALRSALLGDEYVTKAASAEAIKTAVDTAESALKERLEKVEKAAAPSGPVVTRTAEDVTKASAREDHITKAASYDRIADEATDRDVVLGYRELASQHREAAERLQSR